MALIKKKITGTVVRVSEKEVSETLSEDKSLIELAMAHNSKALKRKQNLVAKYHGKQFKPKHKPYYGEGIEPYQLICDDVKPVNLGTGCEKTVMLHFKGEPTNKWEILKHFTLCK